MFRERRLRALKSVARSGSGSDGGAAPVMEDFFVVSTVAPSDMRHRDDQFRDACKAFGCRLIDRMANDYFCKIEFSKGIPANSCVVLNHVIWNSSPFLVARGSRGRQGRRRGPPRPTDMG
jgi:hypothetical protein